MDGEKRLSLNGKKEKENTSRTHCHYLQAFRPERIENSGRNLLVNAEMFLCRGMLVLAGAALDLVFLLHHPEGMMDLHRLFCRTWLFASTLLSSSPPSLLA